MAALDCAATTEDLPVDRPAAGKDKATAPRWRKVARVRAVYASEHVVRLGPVRLQLLRQRLLSCRPASGCHITGGHPGASRRDVAQGGEGVSAGHHARVALESGADAGLAAGRRDLG